MTAVVACLHHLELPSTGLAGDVLRAGGLELDERDLRRGDALPDLEGLAGIVSFGGEQSVRELERHPYLVAEIGLIRRAVAKGTPLLGICLGGQLLARALGAEVRRLERRTIGWPAVERLPASDGDPLFSSLPGTIHALHWNEDFFARPADGVELLTRSAAGAEAFRAGSAWGVQFHPEADEPILDSWYDGAGEKLAEAGTSEPEARAADARHLAAQRELAEALFGAFARLCAPERDAQSSNSA